MDTLAGANGAARVSKRMAYPFIIVSNSEATIRSLRVAALKGCAGVAAAILE